MRQADILVVEDNPDDLELTLHALERTEWAGKTHVARDGEEALDFLFRRGERREDSPDNPPCLVLLDLKLPKLSGIEVLKRVKNDPRTRTIPIVIFTSSKEERDLEDCYRFGVNSYIQKPVNFDEFRQTIRSLESYWIEMNQAPIPATVSQR